MSNIKDLFVSYEIAKQLKDKGFNEVCLGWFQFENYGTEVHTDKYWKEKLSGLDAEEFLNAPLYQQVVDWLELKGISIWVFPVYRGEKIAFYKVNMVKFHEQIDTQELFGILKDSFNTKEEALTKAIEEAIKLI